jgi:hypothetical protein
MDGRTTRCGRIRGGLAGTRFLEHSLSENRKTCYHPSMTQFKRQHPGLGNSDHSRPSGPREKKAVGGRRKPLKRLIPAKAIKGNPGLFLC